MTAPTLTDAEARALAAWWQSQSSNVAPPLGTIRLAVTIDAMARYILARTEPPTPPADWPGRERLPGDA